MTTVEDRLAAARSRYLQSMPAKAAEFDAALATGHIRGSVAGARSEPLATLAHRLAGSAGLHGLDDVARDARALEQQCLKASPTDLATAVAALTRRIRALSQP